MSTFPEVPVAETGQSGRLCTHSAADRRLHGADRRESGEVKEAQAALKSIIVELDATVSIPDFLKARSRFHLALCEQKLKNIPDAERWVIESIRQYDLFKPSDDPTDKVPRQQSVDLYRELLQTQGKSAAEIDKLVEGLVVKSPGNP